MVMTIFKKETHNGREMIRCTIEQGPGCHGIAFDAPTALMKAAEAWKRWELAFGSGLDTPRIPAQPACASLLKELLESGEFWPSAIERDVKSHLEYDEWADRARAALARIGIIPDET